MKTQFIHKLFALAILFTLSSCGSSTKNSTEEEASVEDNAQPEGGNVAKADTASWCDEVVCTGRVDAPPQFQAAVHAPTGGFLRSIHHLPGDAIKQGQTLATLEHQDLIALQEEYLNSLNRLEYLTKAAERNTLLASADAISAKQKDETMTEKRSLEVRMNSLASRLKLLGIDPKRLEQGGALVGSIPILAPISGHLVSVSAVQGQFVSPDQRLFTIVDDTKIHLSLQVMAKDIGRVHEEQTFSYRVTGDSAAFPGHIHRVNKAVDPEKGTVEVHAHTSDDRPLPLGAYVNAQICTGKRLQVVIPISALLGEAEDRWVWKQTGGRFVRQPVKPGPSEGKLISILSGIKPGETVWIP